MIATRLALILVLVAAPVAASGNPHLQRARRALAELHYERARIALDEALAAGNSGPVQLAEIHRLSGIVAAAYGRADEATDAFARLLALNPTAQLTDGLAPKIREPFERARARVRSPLRVRGRPYAPGESEVVLYVDDDPAGMVAGARLLYRDRNGQVRSVEAVGSERIELGLPVPPRPGGAVLLAATDDYGNRLAELRWRVPLDPIETAEAEPVAPDEPAPEAPIVDVAEEAEPERRATPVYARWTTWGGAALGFTAVGAYFSFRTANAQRALDEIIADSDRYNYEEAARIEQRGNRFALAANVSYGTAIACGAVSAVLLVRSLTSDGDSRPARHRIGATPLRGGGAFSLEVDF